MICGKLISFCFGGGGEGRIVHKALNNSGTVTGFEVLRVGKGINITDLGEKIGVLN